MAYAQTTSDDETTTDDETGTGELVETGAVKLEKAQVIAEAEHSASTVVSNTTKTLDGKTVFVFTFEDGWKVYVRTEDGLVVKVTDNTTKERSCENKYRKDEAGRNNREGRNTNAGNSTNGRASASTSSNRL